MPARVALPSGGNPVTASGAISFILPDSGSAAGTPTALLGFMATETTGTAPAKFRLRDGTSASAPVLGSLVYLAANGVQPVLYPNGVEINSGAVFVEVVAGSIELVCYW